MCQSWVLFFYLNWISGSPETGYWSGTPSVLDQYYRYNVCFINWFQNNKVVRDSKHIFVHLTLCMSGLTTKLIQFISKIQLVQLFKMGFSHLIRFKTWGVQCILWWTKLHQWIWKGYVSPNRCIFLKYLRVSWHQHNLYGWLFFLAGRWIRWEGERERGTEEMGMTPPSSSQAITTKKKKF